MKSKFILAVAFTALMAAAAQAQTIVNITGATAFRAGTINAIVAGYGGPASVGVVTSVTSGSYTGSNAISFRGNWPNVGDTIIRCRFSGSTEGIRDLVGTTVPGTPNDVFYYDDTQIPAINNVTYKNENGNPITANVAQKPDVAFSDVQQNSSPYRSPVLGPADSRVGVVVFSFVKSQGSSVNLTNVTSQNWRAALSNVRGVPLNLFTGVSGDATGRVLATGRNDGSGTRAVYMIEPGVGVSRPVNQFKIGVDTKNGIVGAGFTGDVVNKLQLWPSNDAEDVNNNSVLWNSLLNGNGGYFSGSNVSTLLQKDTSAVRVYGPTGAELTTSGSYTSTATTGPRAFSVVAAISLPDAIGAIAGGAAAVAYNGVSITPDGTQATGLNAADRFKVTNGSYTLWSYERLFNRGTLNTDQTNVLYGNTGSSIPGVVPEISTTLATTNSGIALSAMTALRGNDGDPVTLP